MAAGRYFTTVLPVAARWPAPEREALAAVRYGGVILSMIVQELTMECLSGARAGIWGGQPVAGIQSRALASASLSWAGVRRLPITPRMLRARELPWFTASCSHM